MKKSILLICILFVSTVVISQTIVYHENFELNSLADSVSMDSVGFAVNQWAISTTLASQGLRSDSCSVSLSDTTFLTTDAFSTLGNSNVMLSFSHICKIEFFDAAEIFVSNNNGSTWTKLTGTHYLGTGQFGGQGNKFASTSYSSWLPNTNNAIPTNSWWKVEQFDISSIAANSSQVKVRFSLRDGTNNGPMLNYGWLIDDIEVLASFSELIPPTISLNQPVLIDSVYHTGPYDIYATITDVSGIDTAMLIYNYNNGTPDTIGMTNSSANIFFARIDTLNGPFNLSDTFCYSIYAIDASAGQNVATEPAIGCNQFVIYTSPPPSGCSTPITNFPYFEDFETATLGSGSPSNPGNLPSGWTRNPSTGSVYMMLVHSGTTGSGNTGPLGDHTTGTGKYIYAEVSYGATGNFAELISPCMDLTVMSIPQLEFYYHMYGSQTGSLSVDIWYGGQWIQDIWIKNGQQQTSSADAWGKGIVNLIPYKTITKIRFRSKSIGCCAGDIAIDDVKIWIPPANDAGVVSLDRPLSPESIGVHPVKVTIENFGSANLTSATINWEINGVAQTAFNWTGLIVPSGVADSIQIGTYNFTAGTPTMKFWTSNPNGSPDGFTFNDTLLTSVVICDGSLKGIYSVGTASSDFATISDAVNTLNNCGIDSSVVFNIAPGTYTEQVSFSTITGASNLNRVIFQSATANPMDVVIQYAANSTTDNFVVRFDNSSYIEFNNITIKANGASYAYGVNITNGSHHISFENNIIISSLLTSGNGQAINIYDGAACSNITISYNKIQGGYYGIYCYGMNTSSLGQNNVFEGNEITDFLYYGAMFYYQDGLIVRGNEVDNSSSSSSSYSMRLYYCDNIQVVGNKLSAHGTSTLYGMYVYYVDGTSANPSIIANNFISLTGTGTSTWYGVYVYNSTYLNFYYNSINVTGGSPTAGRALYQTSGSNQNYKNNIFSNTGGGYAYYINTPTAIASSDYNDLYTSGANLAYWSADMTNLAALTTASGKDMNSKSVLPAFISPTDLHTSDANLDSAGIPIPGLTVDIDGQTRNALTPDIGADEFIILADDAGITDLVSPTAPCPGDSTDIIVKLKNFGTDTLFTCIVNWELNDTLQTAYNYNGTLLPLQEVNLTIAKYVFNYGFTYKIKSWSSNPNGPVDGNPVNDTILVWPLKTALSVGTYTIGSDSTDDYSNINAAISDLYSYGVCGPVIFNIDSGTYNGQITLSEITGASSTNTITFQSTSGLKTDVVLEYAANSSGDNWVVKLDGADYIIFKNLTIKATGVSYAYGVHLTNGAEHNVFEGNIIQSIQSTSSNARPVLIYSGTLNQYNTFRNNIIKNGYYGIYCYGASSTSFAKGNVFEGNQIKDFYTYGIMSYYQDSVIVRENHIENVSGSTSVYGLYSYYSDNIKVIGNNFKLYGTSGLYALYVYYATASAAHPNIIANNFISLTGGGTSTWYGVYLYNSTYVNFYYNSLNIAGGSTSSRALYQSSGSNHNYKNNIFSNTGGGYAIYMSTPTAILSSDYNNFYTTGGYFAYWSGSRANLSALQTASSMDVHSVSVDPSYSSPTNLHILNPTLDGAGTPIAGITDDIDGDLRNANIPDIGADEFAILSNDIGIVGFYPPAPCASVTSYLAAELKNFGTAPLYTAGIHWSINGVYIDSVSFNGVIQQGSTQIVPIDTMTFNPNAIYDIKVWSTYPNGVYDFNANNDSLFIPTLQTALAAGTYTIGGATADYSSFAAAVNDLNTYGVCGPVVFNIASGTYTEQITIGQILGASSSSTITFQSVTGDSTDVVIQYAATSSANNWVVKLEGADYITFKNVTINASGTSYAFGVYLTNGAEHNVFENNIIQTTQSTSSNSRPLLITDGALSQYNTFSKNVIKNGYYGIYCYGAGTTSFAKGNVFEDNEIIDFYSYGAMFYYQDSLVFSGNEVENASNSTSVYGFRAYYSDNIQVQGNDIKIHGTSTHYGMYIYYSAATTSNPSIVANNFVSLSGTGTSTWYGAYIYNSTNINVYYNTFHLSGGSTSSRSFYQSSGGGQNYLNNIFSNTGGGYAYYISSSTAINSSDHNNFYTTGTYFVYWSGAKANLAALQTSSGKDLNSDTVNPGFVSNTDLHASSIQLNGAGIYIPSVAVDIDGEARLPAPDIGADEYTIPGLDAVITWHAPIPPITSTGNLSIQVNVTNTRIDTITSLKLAYTNGSFIDTAYFNNIVLPASQTQTFTFPTQFNFTGLATLYAYIIEVNDTVDNDLSNDTTNVQTLCVGLVGGTYTINNTQPTSGTNFNSFNDAVSTINCGGISGPVIFNVISGTYTEQISIGSIIGASSVNTITFQSSTGDSTSVVLQFSATSSANNYVVQLNGADYIIFKNITIKANGTSYAYVIEMTGGATHNVFSNNVIQSSLSTSSNARCIQDYTTLNNYNTYRNNKVLNGYYGFYIYGVNTTSWQEGTVIEDNDISGFRYAAMFLYYQDSIQIKGNYIHDFSTSTSYCYGIYAYYCFDGFNISKNRIILSPSGYAYPLRVYYCNYYAYINSNTQEGVISNNFVSVTSGTGTNYGLYAYYNNNTKYYYNSINLSSGSSSSRALYQGNTTANSLGQSFVNNIFNNSGAGYAAYFNTPTSISALDYNNYFTGGTNIAYWSGNKTTLAALQAASGKDQHSVNINPPFTSSADLHLSTTALSGKGTALTGIIDDIDGDPRSLLPSVGADERPLLPFDAGVSNIISPSINAIINQGASVAVSVQLTNYGTDTIFAMNVQYSVNNGTPVSVSYNNTLLPFMSDIITMPSFIASSGNSTICAKTILSADSNYFNDEICQPFFGTPSIDACLTRIVEINDGCGLGLDTIMIWIKNTGVDTINGSIPDTLTAHYQLDGISTIVNEAVTSTINPGDSVLFAFSTLANFTVTTFDSTFNIVAWINLNGDIVTNNDTAYSDVESKHTPPDPIVTSPITIPYATPTTLSALSPTNDSLNWFANDTTSIILASGAIYTTPILIDTTTFWVQAGQVNSGAGNVNIAPLAVASASPACNTGACSTLNDLNFGTCGTQQMWITSSASNPGSSVNVTFLWPTAKSFNKMTIHAGQDATRFLTGGTIQILNGSTWVNHHTFTQAIGVCFYDIDFPVATTTGVRIVDITVGGSQTSNVNFREIEIFEAIAGCPSNRVPIVVNVASQSQCDVSVSSITQPVSAINLTNSEIVSVKVKNYGTVAQNNISVSYQVDNGTIVTDIITTSILPNDSLIYTFGTTANLGNLGNTYHLKAFTSLNCDAVPVNDTLWKNVTNIIPNYCPSAAISTSYIDIENVTFGGINNTSPSPFNALYTNYTNITPGSISPGSTYPISITINSSTTSASSGYVEVYIDYDRDGIFTEPSEIAFGGVFTNASSSNPFTVTGNVVVPVGALNGVTRMRIVAERSASTSAEVLPCGTYSYGETEDYHLMISPRIANDAGVVDIIQPAIIATNSTTPVEVIVVNYGTDTINSVNVSYQLNSGAPITQTITNTILPLDSFYYTFPVITLPTGQNTICAYTTLPNDSNLFNDKKCVTSFVELITTAPYFDNFEGIDYWLADTLINQWERGSPSATVINSAHSGTNVWMIDLDSTYDNSSFDYLYSPKFDFVAVPPDSLIFWHYYNTQASGDGGRIQYYNTTGHWSNMGVVNDIHGVNWCNNISGGVPVWDGNSNGWVKSSYKLSVLTNMANPAQFRFIYQSDATINNFDGWAIDDFKITTPDMPNDPGVIAISSPTNSTQIGSAITVSISIKNYGTASLSTIPVHYKAGNLATVNENWSGSLAPGATTNYTFVNKYNSPVNNYTFCAWATGVNPTYTNNDSVCKNITTTLASYDVGICKIKAPIDTLQCDVDVWIKNYGLNSVSSINVFYHMNGMNKVTETWTGILNSNDSVLFEFPNNAQAPLGTFSFCTGTKLSGDMNASNDSICKPVAGKYCFVGLTEIQNGEFILGQNIPNPTTGTTRITYIVPVSGTMRFDLINVLGQTMQTQEQTVMAGQHSIELYVGDLPAGVYYYSVIFEGRRLVKKMVISK